MVFWQIVLCFIVLSLTIAILYRRGTIRFLYLVSKIRGPSLWSLVTVHSGKFLDDILAHVHELCELYSYEPWGLWTMSGDFLVVLSDVESLKELYKSKNLTTKPDLLYRQMAEYLGEGSVSLRGGESWRLHRNCVSPAFHKAVLALNIDIMFEGAEKIVNEFGKQPADSGFDINHIVDLEFADATIRFLGSGKIVLPDVSRAIAGLQHAARFMTSEMLNPFKHWFQMRFSKETKELYTMVRSVLTDYKGYINEAADQVIADFKGRTDFQPRDVFESGLKHFCQKNAELSKEEIIDECLTVTSAAIDTTKTALKMVILLLALHQEEQQRVFDELRNIFGSSDQRPTLVDLDKMEYLGMVIKETMRLFPPAPMIMKLASEETDINGVIIPKGACALINIRGLHRNPATYKDPLKFVPERFLPESPENSHPYSYLPFSSGIRNCVGQTQAMMALKIILSSIFRRFQVFPGKGLRSVDDIKLEYHITLDISNAFVKVVDRE